MEITRSQDDKWLWRFPATKLDGSLNARIAEDAQAFPLETISIDGSGPAQLVAIPSQLQNTSTFGCDM